MHHSLGRVTFTDNHRKSACSGFENHFGRAFPGGGKQENIGSTVFVAEFLCIQQTEQPDIAEAQQCHTALKLWSEWPVARNPEVGVRKARRCGEQKLRSLKRAE